MRFEVRHADRNRSFIGRLGRNPPLYPHEHPHVAPPLPAVVEGPVGTALSGRIIPAQAATVGEDSPAQDTPVVNARHSMALGKVRSKPRDLSFAQPVQIAYDAPGRSRA